MKLRKKTFIYTLIVSSLVGMILIWVLILFLPGLYLNYRMERQLENATIYHKQFTQEGKVSHNHSLSWIGIKMPKEDNRIYVMNSQMEISFILKNNSLKSQLEKLRDFNFREDKSEWEKNQFAEGFHFEELFKQGFFKEYDIQYTSSEKPIEFFNETSQIHTLSDNSILVESSVNTTEKITYTNFVGMTNQGGDLFISVYGEITPSIQDIKPVIYICIPVLLLIVIAIGVIGSNIFAKTLTKPISVLVNDAYQRRENGYHEPIIIHSKDGVGELAHLLNELYEIQNEQYKALESESLRKEVFMKAFFHQLKNPLASSLLLVDSMKANLGKYQDRDTYLSVLKDEILKIQALMDEVSELDMSLKEIKLQEINIMEMLIHIQEELKFFIEEKNIKVEAKGALECPSDPILLYKILHNLLDNAIHYTKEGGKVEILAREKELVIKNMPTFIPKEIRDNIFEPLVSSNLRKGSRGLGLYIVKTFCQQLDIDLVFTYENEWVEIRMKWS